MVIARSLVTVLVVLLASALFAPYSRAQSSEIRQLSGNVFVNSLPAKPGARLKSGDVVTTGEDGSVVGVMSDGTTFSLGPSSEFALIAYRYDPSQASANAFETRLVSGRLNLETGETAKLNRSAVFTMVGDSKIRPKGTHFEIEIVDGDMFLAVWDGAIDLTVDTGTGTDTVISFGEGEDFSFGTVSDSGEVTQLLEAPDNFDGGQSDGMLAGNDDTGGDQPGDSSDDGENGADVALETTGELPAGVIPTFNQAIPNTDI